MCGVAVTPDGTRAVSASADKTLRVWDLATGKSLASLEGHTSAVYGVAVTPGRHPGRLGVGRQDPPRLGPGHRQVPRLPGRAYECGAWRGGDAGRRPGRLGVG